MELGGHAVAKGDLALPVIGAANPDPEAFDAPGTLDVSRSHSHQLGFGTGPQLCAGIQLARFEARAAFEYLLNALSVFEAETQTLSSAHNSNIRCLSTLPMRVHGA